MAGGHAAAAHRDGEVRRQSVEQRAELLGQLPRRLETAVGETVVACPKCGSDETEKLSEFGSTACKAHWRCLACREPFDYFKCI